MGKRIIAMFVLLLVLITPLAEAENDLHLFMDIPWWTKYNDALKMLEEKGCNIDKNVIQNDISMFGYPIKKLKLAYTYKKVGNESEQCFGMVYINFESKRVNSADGKFAAFNELLAMYQNIINECIAKFGEPDLIQLNRHASTVILECRAIDTLDVYEMFDQKYFFGANWVYILLTFKNVSVYLPIRMDANLIEAEPQISYYPFLIDTEFEEVIFDMQPVTTPEPYGAIDLS